VVFSVLHLTAIRGLWVPLYFDAAVVVDAVTCRSCEMVLTDWHIVLECCSGLWYPWACFCSVSRCIFGSTVSLPIASGLCTTHPICRYRLQELSFHVACGDTLRHTCIQETYTFKLHNQQKENDCVQNDTSTVIQPQLIYLIFRPPFNPVINCMHL
jgi:hypothetical protein